MRENAHKTSISEGERRANTQFLGLDINLPVFSISSGLVVIFSALVLIYPEISNELLSNTRNFVVVWFGTLFSSFYVCLYIDHLLSNYFPIWKNKTRRKEFSPGIRIYVLGLYVICSRGWYRNDFLWSS